MLSLTVGLAIRNDLLRAEVTGCIRDLPVRVLLEDRTLADTVELLSSIEQRRVDVLILDLTQLPEPLDRFLSRVKALSCNPSVIAVNDRADPDVILGAMRGGVREFLYPPLSDGLRKALELIGEERRKTGPPRQGKAIGFLSVKGGCGATTIACHIAVELERLTAQDVVLADLDLYSGMISFLMRAKSEYTILDAAKNVHRLDESFWKALVSNGRGRLDVVLSEPLAGLRQQVDPAAFRQVLEFMAHGYGWAVVDLGGSLNLVAVSLLDRLDTLYLVATMDVPALHQAKQVINHLLDLGLNRSMLRLVINRMPRRPDFESSDIEKSIGLPMYYALPNDYPELYRAYAEGTLLPPSSELAKALSAMAARISGSELKEKPKQRTALSLFQF